jgi:predicted MFS family arabinose efflux permease
VWGRLSDRIGRRPVLLVSIAMTSVAFAIYGLATSFTILLLSRAFAGIATANIAIAQAYVADVTTPEGRARGMGLIGAAFGLGFVLGPAIGGLLSTWSIAAPGFAAAGLAALNGVAAWFTLPEPEHRGVARGRASVGALVDELAKPGIRRLLFCYFLAMLAFSAMEGTYSLLALRRIGLTERGVSYLFTYIGVIVVVVQGGLVGPLTRRFGEKRLLVVGLALQAAALAGLAGAVDLAGMLIATLPLAVGNGLSSPAISAMISRHSGDDDQGGTLGLGQSAAAFGRILGPVAGTTTFSRFSPAFPYVAGALVMVAASVIGWTVRQGSSES